MGTLDYRNPTHVDVPTSRRVPTRWIAGGLLAGIAIFICLISSVWSTSGRARETANRVKCSSNLKWIGQALSVYRFINGDSIPPDISALLANDGRLPLAWCCPSQDSTPSRGATTQAVMADLAAGGHLDYVWAAGGFVGTPPNNLVVAFEAADHPMVDGAPTPGMNVLFGDGHVQFVNAVQARQIRDRFNAGVRPVRWPVPTTAPTP